MNRVVKKTTGFTLIELMLAMSFISVLLMTIAMTIIQISNIYSRGLTLKEVNQAGRSLTGELQRTIKSSAAFPIPTDAVSSNQNLRRDAWGGRLCVGQYSYIWNYGKVLTSTVPSGGSPNKYTTTPNTQIRFIKVLDGNASYCADPTKNIDPAGAVELVNVGDHSLAVHNFNIVSAPTAIDTKTKQQLYTVTFTIGTNDVNALTADASACKGPGVAGADLAYCSVQNFSVVIRAGN